eukprot:4181786-Amphidinium_carterae.1
MANKMTKSYEFLWVSWSLGGVVENGSAQTRNGLPSLGLGLVLGAVLSISNGCTIPSISITVRSK